MGAVVEKMRKEAEKNEEMWTRDKNEWEAKMQALETLNKNINKKMNGNISNNKEVTNRLKQKLLEAEKENMNKNDEIQKLKNKINILKTQVAKQELSLA